VPAAVRDELDPGHGVAAELREGLRIRPVEGAPNCVGSQRVSLPPMTFPVASQESSADGQSKFGTLPR
jgi:hypothetical protein